MESENDTATPPPDAAALLDEVAARVVAGIDAHAFVSWFDTAARTIAPRFDAWLRERGGERLDGGFARALWNRLPHPAERLRPRPLPPVGRNDPCPCGSGVKYKRCCRAGEPSVATLSRLPLLLHVLDAVPDTALETLDVTGADPEELLDALELWGEEGEGERVVRLLAPLFERGGRLPRHAPELLETLLEHWPAGFRAARFDALGERFSTHPDEALAVVATVARVRAASVSDPALARSRLDVGRRRLPDDPELEELEIDVLNAEGRIDEAVRLARTLGERLVALDPTLAEHAEALLERASWVDPELALERARTRDDVLDRLIVLLEETPIAPIAGSHRPLGTTRELVLEATPALAAIEAAWGALLDEAGASAALAASDAVGEDTLTRLVAFLDDEPLALSSFAVVETLARGAGGWTDETWAEALRLRVLERGEALLYRHVTREAGFETADGLPDWDAMVWDTAPRPVREHPANRAALELLAALAARHDDAGPTSAPRARTLLAALDGLGALVEPDGLDAAGTVDAPDGRDPEKAPSDG